MEESRILAIDYGLKRIGIAITDPLNIFAYPLTTLNNDVSLWQNIQKILNENKVSKIIVGFPFKESGSSSNLSEHVLTFKKEIEKRFSLPVELIDERYSSVIAKQRVLETVVSKKKRRDKSLLDKNAAAVLLEDYLNKIKVGNNR